MKKQAWFELFDASCEQFHWAFTNYGYEDKWVALMACRAADNQYRMLIILNQLWFDLPQNVFNANMSLPGQEVYVTLIENA